jgi:hypothetical protein
MKLKFIVFLTIIFGSYAFVKQINGGVCYGIEMIRQKMVASIYGRSDFLKVIECCKTVIF